ncbi:MAG: response regulator transcription factor, partial [Candidatus Moranbacteria bacterium]|nr:response regulator transcription factor [Candidatus Moranbacteria bacterium]
FELDEEEYKKEIKALLLDVMMPKKDGFEVCREIRATSTVPIIMVTARSEDFEKIMGLDIGADDYIVKPFSPSEVMARLRAILRRIELKATDQSGFMIDNLQIDIAEYKIKISGLDVRLTKKEIEVFWILVEHKNMVVSRNQLLEKAWGYDYEGDLRAVDSVMKRLRAKLDALPKGSWEIKTIRGVGYTFKTM